MKVEFKPEIFNNTLFCSEGKTFECNGAQNRRQNTVHIGLNREFNVVRKVVIF